MAQSVHDQCSNEEQANLLAVCVFSTCPQTARDMQDSLNSKRDARTVPVFLHIDRVVKCFAVGVSELFGSKPRIYLPLLLMADVTLLAVNALYSPCCVPAINTIKNIAYAFASWTVAASLFVTVFPVRPHSKAMNQHSRRMCSNSRAMHACPKRALAVPLIMMGRLVCNNLLPQLWPSGP
jgi:hypothetical protein